jgi:hypothetical protein
MTTTALMPLDPSVSPQHANRVLPIRANLLPQDISDGRRARRTRAVVIIAVVLVLGLLSGWYWHATVQKQEAEDDFSFVTGQVSRVQDDQGAYKDLTTTKNSNTKMNGQLTKLMADDLPWQTVLDLVRTTGTKYEVSITQLTGQLAQDDGSATTGDAVGSISINGKAPDKKAVAKYVLALVDLKSKGFTDPFVSNVSGADKDGVTFTMTVSLTKVAQCGKYTTKCK